LLSLVYDALLRTVMNSQLLALELEWEIVAKMGDQVYGEAGQQKR